MCSFPSRKKKWTFICQRISSQTNSPLNKTHDKPSEGRALKNNNSQQYDAMQCNSTDKKNMMGFT